jgi:hypothetical protein
MHGKYFRGEIIAQVCLLSEEVQSDCDNLTIIQVGGCPGDGNFSPNPLPLEGFASTEFDLDQIRAARIAWGLFRDRRPSMYSVLSSSCGGRLSNY